MRTSKTTTAPTKPTATARKGPSAGDAQRARWDAARVQALRRCLGVSQQRMAQEMGVRQQTVSEWETGLYAPRGASARLLGIVAERAGFTYDADGGKQEQGNA